MLAIVALALAVPLYQVKMLLLLLLMWKVGQHESWIWQETTGYLDEMLDVPKFLLRSSDADDSMLLVHWSNKSPLLWRK